MDHNNVDSTTQQIKGSTYPEALVQFFVSKSTALPDFSHWLNYTSSKMNYFTGSDEPCCNQSEHIFVHTMYTSLLRACAKNNSAFEANYINVSIVAISVALFTSLIWLIHNRIFYPKSLKSKRRHFHSILATTLEHIICYSIVTPFAPFLAALLLTMLVLRVCIYVYFKIFYPGKSCG